MFDKAWEKEIYLKKKQINKYPYDWVVSSVNKYANNKKNCLDIGCGTGNNLIFLNKFGFKNIHGIEGSKTACKILRKIVNNKNIIIFNNDFLNFNYKNSYYDLVLDRGSVTHNSNKDIKLMIKKIYKSLNYGGIFMSVMFNNKGTYKTKNKNGRHFKTNTNTKKGLITNFFKKEEIIKMFEKFEIIELKEETHQIHLPVNQTFSTWNIICKKNLS